MDKDLQESKDPQVAILNGDSPIPTRVIKGVVQPVAPSTVEQRLARKNELKARDINLKFLRSIPTEWRTQTLIWRNKTDLEEQSLDDLFNSLKMYEAEVKSSSSASTSTQNIAFVSSQNTNSTNEPVSVVASVSATSANIPVSALPNVDTLSNAVKWYNCHMKGYFKRECRTPKDTRRNVSTEPQRRNVPVETYTSNALVLKFDGVGSYDWSFQVEEEPTNYALMAFTSSSSSSSDNEVAFCSKACTKAYATLQSHYDKLTNDLRKSQFDVISYKTGLESVEARILVYQQNETVFEKDIKLLKLDVQLRDNALVVLRQKFNKAKQERDELKLKLEKFQTSSKNLSQLLASQTNDKIGLGYDNQVFTSSMFDCDEMFSFESDISMPASPKYDRYQSGEGYHVVPPPYTGTFMPPKPDLVFHDAPNVHETAHTTFNVELSPTKPDKDLSHTHRPSAPIIKIGSLTQKMNMRPSLHIMPPTDIPKPKSLGNSKNRKACFVCKSLTHMIKDCDYYEKKMAQTPVRNHAQSGNHQHYARMSHPNPQRHVVPIAVLTKSKLVPLTVARPVTTAVSQPHVTRPRPAKIVVTKPYSPPRRNINRRPSSKPSNFPPKVTIVKAPMVNVVKGVQGNWGNPRHALKDKGVIDSGCSRNMTGNMSYLSDFKAINGGYVAFGGNLKGGKITGKGKIRTGKLDFDDVYFVKELKFNLFSVSQMCDKKNSVLFTDTECIILSPEFKLPDENQVLLRVPTENNMYNVDLKNIVPSGDLTCLFTKETLDESNLWHRRLGHINFKTMNKLVKVVTDDYSRFTWVFFLATKDETSPILKTFITGIENQLRLKVKIIRSDNGTEFKNQDLNQLCGMKGVKREFSVHRTPQQNETSKRKNRTLIEAARTMLVDSLLPIPFWAEAVNTTCYVKNRVLVTKPHDKAPYEFLLGRTPSIGFMRPFGYLVTILNTLDPLGKFDGKADEGFLVGYFVSSKAFRVFNSRTRIVQETLHINFLENKPNVAGSGPTWLFDIDTLIKSMNYQPVTVGNQSNPSACVQEQFYTEKAEEDNVQQYVLFPLWSFGFKDPQNTDGDATFEVKEPEFEVEKPEIEIYVSPSSSAQIKKHDDKTKREAKGKSPVEFSIRYRNLSAKFEDFSDNSINEVNVAGTLVPTVGQISTNSTNTFSFAGPSNTAVSPTLEKSSYVDTSQYPYDPNMPALEDITYSDDEEDVGAEADFTNLETNITVSPIPTTKVHKDHLVTQIIGDLSLATQTRSITRVAKDQGGLTQINNKDFHTCMFACFLSQEEPNRVHQALKDPSWIKSMHKELLQFKMQKVWVLVDLSNGKRAIGHTQEEGIDYEEVFTPVARIEAISLFLAYASFMGFMVYQIDVKSAFHYGTIEEEVYVDDIIFGSTNKDLCKAFEKLMKDKFQMSSMGELTFFLGLQVKQKQDGIFISHDKYVVEILKKFGLKDRKLASTPTDTEKPLLKDSDGEDVDVYTYRLMIGSLMYLTSSRPDIIYLKVKPRLGLWYPKDSPLNLVAYSDSDYAGASLGTKGFSGVETPLFESMIVAHDEVAAGVDVDDVPAADVEPTIPSPIPTIQPPPPSQELPSTSHVISTPPPSLIPQPTSPPQQQQPSQPTYDAAISLDLLHTLLETCTTLTMKVEALEQDKVGTAQRVESSVDTVIDDQEDASKHGEIIANIDADEDVTLKDVADDKVKENADVLSMHDDELEPAEIKEVVEVVITAKLMTKVVTAAATITAATTPITAATISAAPNAARRRKGVVIRDPEEIATPSIIIHSEPKSKDKGKRIMVEEPKPLKKQAQIEHDEAYAKEYQALKRKPQTEAQARKNMMIYLRNMAGFKKDYSKGMSYDDIRLIFEKREAAKKQKLDEEVEELKKYLQIMPNDDDDDVYTEATPLALKVLVVDYEIYSKNNKSFYKIIRAYGSHQLFLSFLSLLRNFDREDLEVLWQLVKEIFSSSKPKNFSDDFLLTTLTYMFDKPDVQAKVWKNQRSVHGLAKVQGCLFELGNVGRGRGRWWVVAGCSRSGGSGGGKTG
nr:ribonuclease H-like domain-containing protein [Tanacetum cinerariifolium]